MTAIHPVNRLLVRLDSSAPPARLEPDERLLFFDLDSGQVVVKKRLIELRNLRTFLVTSRRPQEARDGLSCRLKSPSTRLSLELAFRYEARCERGNEERVVAALGRAERAGEWIDRFLLDRVEDFAAREGGGGRDLCLDLLQRREDLQDYLADCARNELGLTIDIQVRTKPDPDRDLKPIPVQTESFPVRVCDQDDQVELKIVTELEVHPAHRMRAVLFHPQADGLEEAVRQVIRRVLAEETTLHAFTYELTTTVRRRLIEAINLRLAEEGRRISFLRLNSRSVQDPAAGLGEIERSVSCKIADCDEPIVIRHRLQLSLCDLGRFHASGVQDLPAWVTARLEQITREILFDRRYVDLLLSFAPDEATIKDRIEKEVGVVGYAVKQLITAPDLEPLRWKEGFAVPEIDEIFATRDSRIDIGLILVLHGRVVDLRHPKLQAYLRPRSRLLADIRKAALDEARRILHGISPEHFYMRFSYSDIAGEGAVREILETRIGALLAERFAIDEISVIPKPKETDLTKRLELLQKGPHRVEVTCAPLNRPGEEVSYRIDFDVLGVSPSGWYLFCAKGQTTSREDIVGARRANLEEAVQAEIDRIGEVIAEDVRSKIQIAPREILQFASLGHYHALMEVVHQSVQQKVESVFGLVIRIVNLNRIATFGEIKGREGVTHEIVTSIETGKEMANRKRGDLLLLYEKRSEMLTDGVLDKDDSVLAHLEERIRTLEKEISPDQHERGQQELRALLPGACDSGADEWKRLALSSTALPERRESPILKGRSADEEPDPDPRAADTGQPN